MRLRKAEGGGEKYCDLNKCVGFTLGEYCEYCDYCEYCKYCGQREYCDLNKSVGVRFTLGVYCKYCEYCEYCDLNKCVGRGERE